METGLLEVYVAGEMWSSGRGCSDVVHSFAMLTTLSRRPADRRPLAVPGAAVVAQCSRIL